jgi:hypothetical protein
MTQIVSEAAEALPATVLQAQPLVFENAKRHGWR